MYKALKSRETVTLLKQLCHSLCAVCGGNTTVATTLDKDPLSYPPDSLLTDSCDVYGNGSAAPSTYWVGATGTAGHTVTLTLPCTVTIDR
jgi:hypothetical protein